MIPVLSQLPHTHTHTASGLRWNLKSKSTKTNLKLKSSPPSGWFMPRYGHRHRRRHIRLYMESIPPSYFPLKGFCCWELFRLFPASGFRFNPGTPLPLPLLSTPLLSCCVPFSRCAAVDSANVCANIAVFFSVFVLVFADRRETANAVAWLGTKRDKRMGHEGQGRWSGVTRGVGGGTWSEVDGLSLRLIIQTTLKII